MDRLYSVIYRQGGTTRCRWNRVVGLFNLMAAETQIAKLGRAGYDAYLREASDETMPIGWTTLDPWNWTDTCDGWFTRDPNAPEVSFADPRVKAFRASRAEFEARP